MRITVNLGIYFHDHRSLAKIFINNKMKTIKDVENHIAAIFNIDNFYLKCDNQYLPPTEDVHIISNEDIVWAVPNEGHTTSNNGNTHSKDITVEEFPIIKKKKKKQLLDPSDLAPPKKKRKKQRQHEDDTENVTRESDLENDENVMQVDQASAKESKKKKKKKTDEVVSATFVVEENKESQNKSEEKESQNESEENENNDNVVWETGNKSVELSSLKDDASVANCSQKDSGRDSLETSKSERTTPENKNIVKSLVNTFEKQKTNFAKHLFQNANNGNQRRVNIVKTIIISDKRNPIDEAKPDPSSVKEKEVVDDHKDEQNCDATNHVKSQDAQNDDELSNSIETSSSFCYSTSAELESRVTKRRRKRTRKSKKSRNKPDFDQPFEQPIYNIFHKPVIVETPTHIRFDDYLTPKKHEVPVTSESIINGGEEKDSSKNEIIVVEESVISVRESSAADDTEKNETVENIEEASAVINLEATYSDKDIEECILRQPVTRNLEPKIGDVIAFKMLRMSENYTPEVSTPIVGKVINYDTGNKEIGFSIVYGNEQCLVPQGKFSLEPSDLPGEEKSEFFRCSWPSLLEPRLIFP